MTDNELLKRVAKEYSVKIKWSEYDKVVREYIRRENKAREIRRKCADWNFIEKQPEPIKTALKILIETGDIKLASIVSGLKVGLLDQYRRKAKIPIVLL